MAHKMVGPVDFAKNEAQNLRIQQLASAPGSPVEGQIYHNTTDHHIYEWDGSAWNQLDHQAGSFATPALTLGTSNAAGSSTSGIRSDATILAFDATAPTTSAAGDAAAVGSATVAARRDHLHGREGFGAVSAQTTFGASSANGTNTTHARSDHLHGTPTHVGTDHSAVSISSLSAPTGDVAWGSHKITGLLDGTAATDAATKGQMDVAVQGITWKPSAAAATTGVLPNTPTYANGTAGVGATLTAGANAALAAQDGITLAVGDRLLVKDQASALQNGLYDVTAIGSGAAAWVLTRNTSMDQAAEIPRSAVLVEAGTTNGLQGYTVTSVGPYTMGTTAINFTQFTGVADITAGTGLTKSGNTLQIDVAYVGQTSITTLGTITTGTWTGTSIAVANGGTGSTTAAGARTNLGATGKFAGNIGDGAASSFTVTHNLNSTDVLVQLFEISTGDVVDGWTVASRAANSFTLAGFSVVPTSGQYRIVVIG